jgi:sec-independent protein translocase protein TatA
MFGLGMGEVVLILVIGLVLFGNKLPNLARSLGKTMVEFKREANVLEEDLRGSAK